MQVAHFFFQLETEAGELRELPRGCALKLGSKAAVLHASESAPLGTEVVPPSDLKTPSSIEESKVLSLVDTPVLLPTLYIPPTV